MRINEWSLKDAYICLCLWTLTTVNKMKFLLQSKICYPLYSRWKTCRDKIHPWNPYFFRKRHLNTLVVELHNKVLKKINISKCRLIDTQAMPFHPIIKDVFYEFRWKILKETNFIPARYRETDVHNGVTGSNICHMVDFVCQYQANPRLKHGQRLKLIMPHLKGTVN